MFHVHVFSPTLLTPVQRAAVWRVFLLWTSYMKCSTTHQTIEDTPSFKITTHWFGVLCHDTRKRYTQWRALWKSNKPDLHIDMIAWVQTESMQDRLNSFTVTIHVCDSSVLLACCHTNFRFLKYPNVAIKCILNSYNQMYMPCVCLDCPWVAFFLGLFASSSLLICRIRGPSICLVTITSFYLLKLLPAWYS